jgi:hypothetical protein
MRTTTVTVVERAAACGLLRDGEIAGLVRMENEVFTLVRNVCAQCVECVSRCWLLEETVKLQVATENTSVRLFSLFLSKTSPFFVRFAQSVNSRLRDGRKGELMHYSRASFAERSRRIVVHRFVPSHHILYALTLLAHHLTHLLIMNRLHSHAPLHYTFFRATPPDGPTHRHSSATVHQHTHHTKASTAQRFTHLNDPV